MRYIARKHNLCEFLEFKVCFFLLGISLYTTIVSFTKRDSLYCVFLGGETEEEQLRVDILENQAMDFRNGFVQLCYGDFVSAQKYSTRYIQLHIHTIILTLIELFIMVVNLFTGQKQNLLL